jgi:hypothetical protein
VSVSTRSVISVRSVSKAIGSSVGAVRRMILCSEEVSR